MEINEIEKNDEKDIDLLEVISILVSKLPFIILLTVFGLFGGFAIAKLMLPVKYTSDVSIYVNNATVLEQQYSEKANAADIQASKQLASTYIVILQNDEVYDEVSRRLLEEYRVEDLEKIFTISYEDGDPSISAGQLRSLVSISAVNDTEVIKISCTSLNSQISADICTYISEFAPSILIRTTKAGSVEPIGHAKIAKTPSSPNVKRAAIIGGLLGGAFAVGIVIISHLLDTHIKTADDIKKKFHDLPILGELPDLYDTKGGTKY